MSSLHDLIYSQSNEPSSPAKKQPRREENTVSTQDMADTALDRFYKIPNVSSVVPETIVSNGVQRQRKRKRGRRRKYDQEEEELWETASEAERRVQRTQRRTEYKGVKKRWKTRVHNLREEVDYGHSVEHMARLVMKRRKQTPQIETDRKPAAVQDVVIDSSDEEQQDALGSLWASMTPQEESKDIMEEEEDELDESWDYWQLGYNTPRIKDLQDFYYYQYTHNNPFELNYSGRKQRLEEIENESVTLPPIRKNDPSKGVDEQTYYLQRQLPTTCFTHSTFHHFTNLRTMAARFLTGSAGKNEKLENRLLRDLYSQPTRKVGREYHVLTQSMERGREFVLFKSHRWKQRSVAARALGVTAEYEHTGPTHRIGFSLERDGGLDRVGLEHTNNVVRLLSDGKIPYQPHEKTCAINNVEEAMEGVTGIEDSMNIDHNENVGSHADQEEPYSRTDDKEDYDDIDSSSGTPRRTKVETEEGNKQNDPDATCFRTYLSSDVDYVHIPGTSPPIPSFPLDETSVIIGGEDRYSRVYHNARIDDMTYTVTVSVLLARLGRARLQEDTRAIEQVQGQILTYVKEVANENVRLLTQMSYTRRKRNDQPSALYYKAMMGFCSIVTNSGCSLARKNHTENAVSEPPDWLDDDSYVDDAVPAEAKASANMNAAAQTIYEQCAGCPSSSSLTIFPRIHITTALAFIAKYLPASAVDILSRPFDETSYRTPFDIMRKTFEHLEKDNLLTDSHIMRSGEDSINVGHLEHIVHEGTAIFRKAMEMDPCDLFNHAWYISGLAVSLLLCSGNAIGPKAHVRPSCRKRNEEYDIIFSSPEDVTTQPHEVRQRLPKFAALRRDVANAIKTMIELALAQKNSRGHLIASAVLEWKQVIALLVGPRSEGIWSDIRTLHSQHAVQWAIKERSQSALCMVKEMVYHQNVSSDALLVILAADLESNPNNVFAWRRLISALGPIGVKVSSRRRKECERRECAECKSLHKGLNMDHVMIVEREDKLSWWGSDRVSWWHSHVLALAMESAVSATPIEIFRVGSALEKRLVQEARSRHEVSREQNAAQKPGVGLAFDEHADMRWLDDQALSDSEEDFDSDHNGDYDSLLPAHFEDMIRATQESNEASSSLVFDRNGGDPKLEITCYKIISACHLYSVTHDLVRDGVWLLAQGCWRKAECNEWRCLLWLSSIGLYLPQILHDLYTQCSPPRLARYPEEEKEAMKAGLELFSQKWKRKQPIWKYIRDHFPVFKDSSRLHLSCIYLAMKRSGELGSVEEK